MCAQACTGITGPNLHVYSLLFRLTVVCAFKNAVLEALAKPWPGLRVGLGGDGGKGSKHRFLNPIHDPHPLAQASWMLRACFQSFSTVLFSQRRPCSSSTPCSRCRIGNEGYEPCCLPESQLAKRRLLPQPAGPYVPVPGVFRLHPTGPDPVHTHTSCPPARILGVTIMH